MDLNFIMDNDSGYVSHNQESNLDSSSENICNSASYAKNNVYLNEDTLLEKPTSKNVCNSSLSDSFDSVVNTSRESLKTNFSGFDDSFHSNTSFIIPQVKPITWHSCGDKESYSGDSLQNNISGLPKTSPFSQHKILANVTNTYDQHTNQTLTKSVNLDKENICVTETPPKNYECRVTADVSPDLFAEEEMPPAKSSKQKSPMDKHNGKQSASAADVKLLKNVQGLLSGVHPPPCITTFKMNVTEILQRIDENQNLFWNASNSRTQPSRTSLLVTNRSECVLLEWPDILHCRFHGLHYNRSKSAEEFEHLCLKYAERYVASETQSTCTVFASNPPSSQKRKFVKPRWGNKSPGRRLSHLARRRITFSSANIQASSSSAILGSRARQILVDARKLGISKKSPKASPRETPARSPFKTRKNTPSSSAKKKLAMRFREMSGEFETTGSSSSCDQTTISFKRSLFGTEKESGMFSGSLEKKSTKRALFSSPLKHSPNKKSPLRIGGLDRKRKRTDSDNGIPSKLARCQSLVNEPTKSEFKPLLCRSVSQTMNSKPEELSDLHKKKLQWAVYESLRLQNITPTHPQFKVFASVLARVTRKFLPNLQLEGGTTDKMFRIARHHSYAVVKGKTVDEIIREYMKSKSKNAKLHGYVGIDEFNRSRDIRLIDKENILHDKANIIESIEKRREHAGSESRFFGQNKLDRIRKVISFEDTDCKK